MKNILVTGGAGYIGSHTCKALKTRGYNPVVFDNLEHGHSWAVKWGVLEEGDLLDPPRLREVLDRHAPDAIVHFAAYAYVGESVTHPAMYYRNNVVGSLNLLDEMRHRGLRNIVFSSTCATYGIPDTIPITEAETQQPINPYGYSKLMVERLLRDYAAAYGINACSLRYFNAAGADPDAQTGEIHDPEPHLIPNVLKSALGEAVALRVFGDDYETRDGTCVRDFVHVTDLAEAHCMALDYLTRNPGFHAFNLGSEKGHSVMEVIRTAEKTVGRAISYEVHGRRPGDPPVLVANSKRAETELGWRRHHSDLGEILETALTWHRRCAEKHNESRD